jgi:hypothetical protein
MKKEKEEWKEIPEYEGLYEASTFGEIRHFRTKKLLVQHFHLDGHPRINLTKNGSTNRYKVCNTILFTFKGPPLDTPEMKFTKFAESIYG